MRFAVPFSTASLIAAVAMAGAAPAADAVYVNARFGYELSYPTDRLVAQPEASNGDGRRFRARDGSAEMAVWGGYNALEQSPAALARAVVDTDCGGRTPALRVARADLVAVSCLKADGRIVYQKTLIHSDVLTTLRFDYPAAERATWDPVVKRVSASMKQAK